MKIVTGLAWPAVVLVSVIVMRRQLGRLISRLVHAEVPGGKFDFSAQAAAAHDFAEAVTPQVPIEPPDIPGEEVVSLNDMLRAAETHPVGAIVRAWNMVDVVVKGRLSPTPDDKFSVIELLTVVKYQGGEVTDDIIGLAKWLSDLRDHVVHGKIIPTPAAARDYVDAVARLLLAVVRSPRLVPMTPPQSSS